MGAGEAIALIAGAGRLPVVLAEAVKARGHGLVCVTIEGDGEGTRQIADYAYRTAFGEIDRIISILESHHVRRVLLAGQVPRSRVVEEGDAIFRAGSAAVGDRRDQSMFLEVLVPLLARSGIEVMSPLEFIGHLRVESGVLTRRAPSEAEWEDIRIGMTSARVVADMDIGQTVVVKHGVILAVEAAEGTDATIQRAGAMVQGAVVVKVARPRQDERFDLPTVGLQTVATLQSARASVLAVEAGRTLLLDRAEALAAADRGSLAIVGIELPRSEVRSPESG